MPESTISPSQGLLYVFGYAEWPSWCPICRHGCTEKLPRHIPKMPPEIYLTNSHKWSEFQYGLKTRLLTSEVSGDLQQGLRAKTRSDGYSKHNGIDFTSSSARVRQFRIKKFRFEAKKDSFCMRSLVQLKYLLLLVSLFFASRKCEIKLPFFSLCFASLTFSFASYLLILPLSEKNHIFRFFSRLILCFNRKWNNSYKYLHYFASSTFHFISSSIQYTPDSSAAAGQTNGCRL